MTYCQDTDIINKHPVIVYSCIYDGYDIFLKLFDKE